jgi:hypothetical protein
MCWAENVGREIQYVICPQGDTGERQKGIKSQGESAADAIQFVPLSYIHIGTTHSAERPTVRPQPTHTVVAEFSMR